MIRHQTTQLFYDIETCLNYEETEEVIIKKQIIDFIKPDRNKVVVTFLYPYLSWVLVFILYVIAIITGREAGLAEILSEVRISDAFIRGLQNSAISYPFICSIFMIFRSYKSGGVKKVYSDKISFSLILFGIIISNPLSLVIISTYLNLYFLISHYSALPGVVVTEVSLDSPVERGLLPGDRIYEMKVYRNGSLLLNKKINKSIDFYYALNQTKVGDRIRLIGVGGETRTFYVKKNVTDWGIKVRDTHLKN